MTAAPRALGEADQRLRRAAHLRDGAGRGFDRVGPHRLDRVDHESRGVLPLRQRCDDVLDRGLGRQARPRLGKAEPFGAQPHLRDGFFAGDVDGAVAGVRERGGGLDQQRRFADARIAAISSTEPRTNPPPVTRSNSATPEASRGASCVSPASGSSANTRPLRAGGRAAGAVAGAFLGDRVPFAAGVALALPAAVDARRSSGKRSSVRVPPCEPAFIRLAAIGQMATRAEASAPRSRSCRAAATSSITRSSPIRVTKSPRRDCAVRQVGDIDAMQIHRNAADDRTALSGDDRLAAGLRFAGASGAQIIHRHSRARRSRCATPAWRSRSRHSRRSRLAATLRTCTIRPLNVEHRPHRIGSARRRIDAVKRDSRPRQIEMGRCAEKDAGGVGERGRDAVKQHAQLAKEPDLNGVERMIRHFGAGEVAHQQRDAVVFRCRRGASAAASSADMPSRFMPVSNASPRRRASPGGDEGVPLGELDGAVDDRLHVEFGEASQRCRAKSR